MILRLRCIVGNAGMNGGGMHGIIKVIPLVIECNIRQVKCFNKPGAYITHNATQTHSDII